MAWTYSDWITQSDQTTKVERLKLHIQEVSDQVSFNFSAEGYSRQNDTNERYLAGLHKHLAVQEAKLAAASGTGRPVAVATRRRR